MESDYEISLVPTNGGRTDFLLSLDSNNKYPTIENNMYTSKDEFTTYSVLVDKETIKKLLKSGNNLPTNL